jgi:hypothetical protein
LPRQDASSHLINGIRAEEKRASGAKARGLGGLCGTAEEAAEKRMFTGLKNPKNHPSGPKGHVRFVAFAARLKPCPFKTSSFSAGCEAVPFQSRFMRWLDGF